MFRCAFTLLLLLAGLLMPPAQAQGISHRNFPAHALRGELVIGQPPETTLNGRPARLAPGVRIRGEDNLLRMSGALVGQRLVVHYTRENGSGLLLDVWVLNAAERANRLWPSNEADARAWVFDPVGQVWSRP